MRIVVLGGAGDMGGAVVEQLCRMDSSAEVIVADVRLDRAKDVVARVVGGRPSARFVDVEDRQSLIEVLRGADVAVNCVGPFYRFCRKVISTVIDSGTNYVDICDDHDGARDALEFDPQAREKGVVAVTGFGWTPGLSNICARAGADELDRVESIDIAWVGTAADSTGLAVIEHVLHAISGRVPTFKDGSLVDIAPGSGVENVEFPQPIGRVSVYHTGHPEPLTIPRYIRGVKTVTLKGALTPQWVNSFGSFLVSLGLTKTAGRKKRLARYLHSIEGLFRGGAQPISGLRVSVGGEKDGRPASRVYATVGPMARLTAIPAALGALWVASGKIRITGVNAPEGCVEPRVFFEALRAEGIEISRLAE